MTEPASVGSRDGSDVADAVRVLVVDDEEIDREVLVRLLARLEFAVVVKTAGSAEEARAVLAADRFDTVFLDYRLGPERGLDLLPDVAAHRPQVCPAILVTLQEDDCLIVDAVRAGASDYLPKSGLDLARLRGVLEGALARAAREEHRRGEERRFREIAERMQRDYEETLVAAAERAEAAARARTLFVANMSHEIRTPLNAVIGLCYLLEQTRLDAEQAAIAAKIRVAGKSLLGIVNNVLDVAKLGAGEVRLECLPIALADFGRELCALAGVQTHGRPLVVDLDLAPGLPGHVLGDPTRLHQVLLNLLANAVKFTERGRITLAFAAGLDDTGQPRLVASVRDTGIGIAPEHRERLFEPFAQADSSTTRTFGGTGLGLSISRDLVLLMGGSIAVESEPGVGSVFRVDLPLIAADTAPADSGPGARIAPDAQPLRGIEVLLVDDCDINLEVAGEILSLLGAAVTPATNGQEAVELALEGGRHFDLVLMDLQMPVLDGRDAFRCIAGGLGEARPVVLALTAATGSAQGGVDIAGMDGLVPKPFDVDELVTAITRHVDAPAIARRRCGQGASPQPSLGVS